MSRDASPARKKETPTGSSSLTLLIYGWGEGNMVRGVFSNVDIAKQAVIHLQKHGTPASNRAWVRMEACFWRRGLNEYIELQAWAVEDNLEAWQQSWPSGPKPK